MTSLNALFQTPRTVRTILQHLDVVVRFQHEGVCVADAFRDEPCDVPKVGGETNICGGGAQQETRWVLGIVRNCKCLHGDVANVKTATGNEQSKIRLHPEDALNFFHCGAVAIDRDPQFVGEPAKPHDVIRVLMSDENCGEILRCASDAGEALANLAAAESGVNQDTRFVGFDVRAVS